MKSTLQLRPQSERQNILSTVAKKDVSLRYVNYSWLHASQCKNTIFTKGARGHCHENSNTILRNYTFRSTMQTEKIKEKKFASPEGQDNHCGMCIKSSLTFVMEVWAVSRQPRGEV